MDSHRDIKSGFVAIIGRPNVGKSSLLNALVGVNLAIVSPKPQTTRNRILGVLTRDDMQAVFLDTPGIHRAKAGFNKRMVDAAMAALSNVDLILRMVETGAPIDNVEMMIGDAASSAGTPAFLVINKIDRLDRMALLPEIERFREKAGDFDEIVPISALKARGLKKLVELTKNRLPPGPLYYPPDSYTDLSERFIAAEMVREQILRFTRQELPHSCAVTVEEFVEDRRPIFISARIHVESRSQRGIIIGAGGTMVKKIGVAARQNIEKMTGAKVFLELKVDVMPKWRRDEKALDKLGF